MTTQSEPVAEKGHFIFDHLGPYKEGDIAQLECDPGFWADTYTSQVKRDGTGQLVWVPLGIACQPMTLDTLPETEYGTFTVDHEPPYILGDKATLECHKGYETEEYVSVLTLGEDLQPEWNPPDIPCGISKDILVLNGKVIFTYPGPYFFGEMGKVYCNPGYVSNIEKTHVLSIKGQLDWSYDFIRCQPESCPTGIHYQCPAGYRLMYQWENDFIPAHVAEFHCSSSGQWNSILPKDVQCDFIDSMTPPVPPTQPIKNYVELPVSTLSWTFLWIFILVLAFIFLGVIFFTITRSNIILNSE